VVYDKWNVTTYMYYICLNDTSNTALGPGSVYKCANFVKQAYTPHLGQSAHITEATCQASAVEVDRV
jgi:hypothetical protein